MAPWYTVSTMRMRDCWYALKMMPLKTLLKRDWLKLQKVSVKFSVKQWWRHQSKTEWERVFQVVVLWRGEWVNNLSWISSRRNLNNRKGLLYLLPLPHPFHPIHLTLWANSNCVSFPAPFMPTGSTNTVFDRLCQWGLLSELAYCIHLMLLRHNNVYKTINWLICILKLHFRPTTYTENANKD